MNPDFQTNSNTNSNTVVRKHTKDSMEYNTSSNSIQGEPFPMPQVIPLEQMISFRVSITSNCNMGLLDREYSSCTGPLIGTLLWEPIPLIA